MNLKKYLNIAKSVADLSKDDTKVGAVLIGPNGEGGPWGYNGAPRGCSADEDERKEGRPEKYYWFEHAERNAIYAAARTGFSTTGCSLVVTHFPCMDCARAIVQAGIKSVVVAPMTDAFKERWADHIERSYLLFEECGVSVEVVHDL